MSSEAKQYRQERLPTVGMSKIYNESGSTKVPKVLFDEGHLELNEDVVYIQDIEGGIYMMKKEDCNIDQVPIEEYDMGKSRTLTFPKTIKEYIGLEKGDRVTWIAKNGMISVGKA